MEKDYFILENTATLEYMYEDGIDKVVNAKGNNTTVYNVILKVKSCCYNCYVKRFYNKYHLFKSNKISFLNENERSLNNIYIKLKIPKDMMYIPKSMKIDSMFEVKGYDEDGNIIVLINELKSGKIATITFDTRKIYEKCIPKEKHNYIVAIVLAEYSFCSNNNENIFDKRKWYLYSN